MALISPGIQISVTDESNYLPTAVGSVPLVLVATAQDKANPSLTVASGTIKSNAGKINVVSSQRELASLFGYPVFRQSSAGTPLHGDELNEYGLMAAYSALGVASRAYIQRADVDLDQLVGTAVRPTGTPTDGTYWLDLTTSRWGINEWNSTQASPSGTGSLGGTTLITPMIITDSTQVSSGTPLDSVGAVGSYAIVTTSTANQLFYKTSTASGAWVQVGGETWKQRTPALSGNVTVLSTIAGGGNLMINGVNVVIASTRTLTQVITAINAAYPGGTPIPGVLAANVANTLTFYIDSSAQSGNVAADGTLSINTANNSNAAIIAALGLTNQSNIGAPAVSFSSVPVAWKTTSGSDLRRPSGSIWINTNMTDPTAGFDMSVKKYGEASASWSAITAPMYADDYIAINALDPLAGGLNIDAGTIYVKYDVTENGNITFGNDGVTPTVTNGLGTFTPFVKTVSGVLKVTGAIPVTPAVFVPGAYFTVQVSRPGDGNVQLSDIRTVTMTGTTSTTFVADFLQATGGMNIVAVKETSGAISISHLAGGYIRLKDVSGTSLALAGFSASVAHMRVDTDEPTVLIASSFEPLTFTSDVVAPFSDPDDGTIWYNGSATDVDIMVHDGSAWRGYGLVASDARGYDLRNTDPAGVLFGTVKPTVQLDGTALVSGDLWIDTSDLENYPKISRFDAATNKWTLLDNTDQLTEDGIIFADARWDTSGNTNPLTDTIVGVATMLLSDYTDIDVPDYRLYARGTLLFNTRRSGYNVKKFVSNYFNTTSFPTTQTNNPVNAPGHTAHTATNAWISISGLKSDGQPYMGRKAVRAVVVSALQAALDSSIAVREEQLDFNIIACPGYPELIDNMSLLNNDRKGTAFILGDTPMHLAAESTALSNWGASIPTADGEDGIVTIDGSVGVFYPSGISNDLSGAEIAVPPSHMMLRTMIRNDNIAYPWFAPAGVRRGTIDNVAGIGYVPAGTNQFTRVGINEGLRDVLYNNRINPLTVLPGIGLTNFGNKTRSGVNSSLDRINVSRLVSYIRRRLASVANNYLFEPNDAITRNSIKLLVETLFNDLMAKRGITDYVVVCDESNNTPDRVARNELYVDVAIEPTKDVEFIYIPIRLKNPGEIKANA